MLTPGPGSQANTPLDELEVNLSNLKIGVKRVANLASSVQNYGEANTQLFQAQESLNIAEKHLAELESHEAQSNAQLVILLQDAKAYLTETPDTLCPVCEQAEIEPSGLVQRLGQRIEGMDNIKQANDMKSKAEKYLQDKKTLLKRAEDVLFENAEAAQSHFAQDFPQLESIKNFEEDRREQAIQVGLALHNELITSLPKLQTELDTIQKQSNTLTTIKQLVRTLDEKAIEAKQTEVLQKRLEQAVEVFEVKRKAYVRNYLA